MSPEKQSNHSITLFCLQDKPSESDLKAIEAFNAIIKKDGCFVLYNEHHGRPYINLTINYETAGNSRGAGRMKKRLNQGFTLVRAGEVRKMLENKPAEEVAAELGVSRSTLFRRLRGKDDSRLF